MTLLTNMKTTPAEAKAEAKEQTTGLDAPEYPYGLSISLEEEGLAKLGITALPAVGKTFALTARVIVDSVSERKELDGDVCQRVSLQITDMALGADAQSPAAAAATLYQ